MITWLIGRLTLTGHCCTSRPFMWKNLLRLFSSDRDIQEKGGEMQGFIAPCVALLSVVVHTATGFNARLQTISLSTLSISPATSSTSAGLPPRRVARHSLYSSAFTRSLTMQSPTSSSTAFAQQAQPTSVADTVIVGSGPTGLACALMLARRGYKDIHVYDRLPEPPAVDSKDWGDGRNYNVGLSGRGQKVDPPTKTKLLAPKSQGCDSSHHSPERPAPSVTWAWTSNMPTSQTRHLHTKQCTEKAG